VLEVGRDVDLADAAARQADGGLDHVSRHARAAMQDEMDRGAGPDRLEPREIDARLARRVMAMRRADRDGERVDAGLGDEAAGLVGIGELLLVFLGLDEIGGADPAELGLDGHAAGVGVGDDGARDAHVVGKRRRRLVDHHRGEAGGDRRLDHRHLEGVVEMEHHRDGRAFRLEGAEKGIPERGRGDSVALHLALRDLHDRGRARALGGAQDRPDHRRVARRERAERVALPLGDGECGLQRDEGLRGGRTGHG